jgi:hypothetical protein
MHFEITQTAHSSESRPIIPPPAALCLDLDDDHFEHEGRIGAGPCDRAER